MEENTRMYSSAVSTVKIIFVHTQTHKDDIAHLTHLTEQHFDIIYAYEINYAITSTYNDT